LTAPTAPSFVLDASALLALFQAEAGAERVQAILDRSSMSAVNWSEVLNKSIDRGVDIAGMTDDLVALGVTVEPFTVQDSEAAARLRSATRTAGLALGDRACLSLALRMEATAITADRTWLGIDAGVSVELIR
jgi:PIN domain nuclease of toxin-antitoxin system